MIQPTYDSVAGLTAKVAGSTRTVWSSILSGSSGYKSTAVIEKACYANQVFPFCPFILKTGSLETCVVQILHERHQSATISKHNHSIRTCC